MSEGKTIKEQNAKMIWTFFSFNALLFYVLAIAPIISFKDFDRQVFITGRGIWLLVLPVVLFILNGLISSEQKAIITFWRFKNPLPACRAFSFYARKDDRVDFKRLETGYSPFPATAKEQNALWYRIFKNYQEEPIVKKSHKDFLLGRDMCAIAWLFLVFGSIIGIFLISDITKWWYLVFTLIQYLALAIVTQNHGKRFVCNVLALESLKGT
jgi:hypothetical protein